MYVGPGCYSIKRLVIAQVWPKDALEAVAYKFLKEMDLEDATRGKLVELCQSVHRKASIPNLLLGARLVLRFL